MEISSFESNAFLSAFLAAVAISLISLVAIFLFPKKASKKKVLFWMISFSAGSLMGGAFFHLIPEALGEGRDSIEVFKLVLVGFVLFFFLERALLWHHCHEEECDSHLHLGYQNLFGDGAHNFLDGLILISAFSVDFSLGLAATISVMAHEIPQEVGDFGVLLYSGFSKKKAVILNLFSALLAVLGVVVGFFLIGQVSSIINILVPVAAGGFIYIAAADLVPELHREKQLKRSLGALVLFVVALLMMLELRGLG